MFARATKILFWKLIAEHGKAALGSLARGFVLNHIPSVWPEARSQFAVCLPQSSSPAGPCPRIARADYKVAISNHESGFILKGRPSILYKVEQSFAPVQCARC